MIYAINALFFGWIASFWSKSGMPNILLSLAFVLLALTNCALAAPFVLALLGVQP